MSIVGVIPAAGKSSRMGRPKHLLKHRGKPLIYHAIDKLIETRVERIIIIYNDKRIPQAIGNYHLGVRIDYVKQKEQNGIGHALSLVKEEVGLSDILLILGDVYYSGNLNYMRDYFERIEPVVLYGLKHCKDKQMISESYGVYGKRIIEKPKVGTKVKNYLGLGIYFMTNEIFNYVHAEPDLMKAIDSVCEEYRQGFVLYGDYENVNYRKDLK